MEGLILLDWDRTITDRQNRINDPDLKNKIQEMISLGWTIGLNSDTPLKRLKNWGDSLNINGPIIAEKGAVVWWPGCKKPEYPITKLIKYFADIRERIILELISDKKFEDYALFFGDSTEFVNSTHYVKCNDPKIVVIDAYRECSIGLFIRRIFNKKIDLSTTKEQDTLLIDNLVEMACISYLKELDEDLSSFSFDINNESFFRGVHSRNVKKTLGVSLLFSKWGIPPITFMIGDSIHDYLDMPEIIQLAVGNASNDYKSFAKMISKKEFAQGCVELFSFIQNIDLGLLYP